MVVEDLEIQIKETNGSDKFKNHPPTEVEGRTQRKGECYNNIDLPFSESTGAICSKVRTSSFLTNGQETCFQDKNSITCFARCLNFSKLMCPFGNLNKKFVVLKYRLGQGNRET